MVAGLSLREPKKQRQVCQPTEAAINHRVAQEGSGVTGITPDRHYWATQNLTEQLTFVEGAARQKYKLDRDFSFLKLIKS